MASGSARSRSISRSAVQPIAIANEDRGLAIADLAVHEMGWARNHEQLVAIDVELWQLVCEERVLDRQRVQVVVLLELAQLRFARLEQSDPPCWRSPGEDSNC
jgi:hypothetical protein